MSDSLDSLNLDNIGSGIEISGAAIAGIVVLLVLALIGLIIATAYAFGGFERCCSCCCRSSRKKKRIAQLPVYSDRGYLDERDKLPAWNPNASTTETQGLSRMANTKQGLFPSFGRKDTFDRPLMLDDSPRNSQLTRNSQLLSPTLTPGSPYLPDHTSNQPRW